MSTKAKVAVAIILGSAFGSIFGGAAQLKLIFSVYYADHITREYFLSRDMCFFLGAVTAAAFVLWQAKMLNVVSRLCMVGGAICLLWLSTDHDSQFYGWWNIFSNSRNQESFHYWNSTINSYREFIADALIFNGIPFLWAITLFWWGLKLLIQDCKNTRHTGG